MVILNILWPTFVLVALIFAVVVTMVVKRLGHMKRNPPGADTFATGDNARAYFSPVALPGDNLANLFETPVLYIALVPLLMLTTHATIAQIALAWIYVALRVTHSVAHIGGNMKMRFLMWLASIAVLSAMWIGFFVDMLSAAITYQAAMSALAHP